MGLKKIGYYNRLFVGVILAIGLVACAAAPVQQMSDARQRIQVAIDAGAKTHASAELAKSEALLAQAQSLIDQRNFGKASEIARQATEAAEQAKKIADQAKGPR